MGSGRQEMITTFLVWAKLPALLRRAAVGTSRGTSGGKLGAEAPLSSNAVRQSVVDVAAFDSSPKCGPGASMLHAVPSLTLGGKQARAKCLFIQGFVLLPRQGTNVYLWRRARVGYAVL